MVKRTNPYSFQESAGNRIIAQELEKNRRIKTYFSENDKTPNTDGYFEILGDGGMPVRRFVVQIKSTESDQKIQKLEQGKYVSDAAFFQYIQNKTDSNPAMFFVIDVENAKTYFKHLSPEYLQSLHLRENQETVTVCFDSNEMLDEEKFYELCADICKGEQLSFASAGIISGKEFPYSVRGGPIALNRGRMNSFEVIKSIRKLKDGLWVNWKTGILADDAETALSWKRQDSDSSVHFFGEAHLPIELSPAKLRLLSVLVQGEGAVVCWDEIYERCVAKHKEVGALGQGSTLGSGGARREATAEERLVGAAGEDTDIMKKAIEAAALYGEDEDSMARKVEASIDAIRKLCAKAPALADMIRPAESGRGYRLAEPGMKRMGECFSETGEDAASDWELLETISYRPGKDKTTDRNLMMEENRKYASAWIRRCYAESCDTFENRVSNAGESSETESRTFGDYAMVETYMNAYASGNRLFGTEAMLDFVEEWYSQKTGRRNSFGKVLVLHGQPGDGKTTFCKKAVYARCFEGWLMDAPHVFRINLNPLYAGGEIISEGMLDLERVLCITRPSSVDMNRYWCDPMVLGEAAQGSLVILDGYDELAGSLRGILGRSQFRKFCEAVRKAAFERRWNIIITSRTMCIETELDAVRNLDGVTVAAFAPLTAAQQDMMIHRMAELSEADGLCEEADSLLRYQSELSELRKPDEENGFDRLLTIPILFRMIVAYKFKDLEGVNNSADLYTRLFFHMMHYKGKSPEEKRELLISYEEIAARIFTYDGNATGTCPYGEEIGDSNRELLYIFLTRNSPKEKGHLGFLHREFAQYFLARYIVSGIQGARDFSRFFRSLRAYPMNDGEVWRLVREIVRMKGMGREKDPFLENKVTDFDIEGTLKRLNREVMFAGALAGEDPFMIGLEAKHKGWGAAEQAVRNLFEALSVVKGACQGAAHPAEGETHPAESEIYFVEGDTRTREGKSDEKKAEAEPAPAHYRHGNVSEMLRRGKYAGINLGGLDFSGANLAGADFKGACLRNTKFQGADLGGANLSGANLDGTRLENANLAKADFSGTDLRKAKLRGSVLKGANLSDTRLAKAHLEGMHLENANLMGADLTGAHLAGVHLEGAFMDGACLVGADLKDAWLTGASMRGVYLNDIVNGKEGIRGGASFSARGKDGIRTGAPSGWRLLVGAGVRGTDFTGAFLSEDQYVFLKKKDALGLPLSVPDGDITLPYGKPEAGEAGLFGSLIKKRTYTINPKTDEKVVFGRYWQETWKPDNELHDEDKTDLSWIVLRREYDKVLLIAEKMIACRQYHEVWTDITWEECSLRRWLNEKFFYDAFGAAERERVALACNQNPDNERYRHSVEGGRTTWDRVFLLSLDEAETYFSDDRSRVAEITPYAREQYGQKGYVSAPSGWWWLRSPGDDGDGAACVAPGGGVNDGGIGVGLDYVFVRPALWLNL